MVLQRSCHQMANALIIGRAPSLNVADVHAAVLGLPAVERLRTDPMPGPARRDKHRRGPPGVHPVD